MRRTGNVIRNTRHEREEENAVKNKACIGQYPVLLHEKR